MGDGACLSVDNLSSELDHTSVRGVDALEAHAHAKDRHAPGEVLNDRNRNTAVMQRMAWAGRNHNVGRVECFDLFDGDLVVTVDDQVRTELRKKLHRKRRRLEPIALTSSNQK